MSSAGSLASNLSDQWKAICNLGFLQAVFYKLQKLRSRFLNKGEHLVLFAKDSRFPLAFRAKTSDADAFGQIFVAREYRCLDDLRDASLIIDCGANVGYASAYFLSRFPHVKVIAIEPDKQNFMLLQKNLAPYKGRYRALCAAVWSRKTGLVISEENFGDGREWSRSVRESRPQEKPELTAYAIGDLLKESGCDRISVLKIDIEGSERQVFGSRESEYRDWIGRVDNLVIELHGDDCRTAFLDAIGQENFQLSRCDELTVCRR